MALLVDLFPDEHEPVHEQILWTSLPPMILVTGIGRAFLSQATTGLQLTCAVTYFAEQETILLWQIEESTIEAFPADCGEERRHCGAHSPADGDGERFSAGRRGLLSGETDGLVRGVRAWATLRAGRIRWLKENSSGGRWRTPRAIRANPSASPRVTSSYATAHR